MLQVRDVAKAHLQALVKKEATDGKRYLIHSETVSDTDCINTYCRQLSFPSLSPNFIPQPSPSQLIDIAHRNFPAQKNLWAKPVTPVQPLVSSRARSHRKTKL